MAPRVVIVSPDSSILRDSSTHILHTYANGEVLVRTEARTEKSEAAQEEAIAQGLQLEGLSEDALNQARATLEQPQVRMTTASTLTQASLSEEVAASTFRYPESPGDQINAYVELIGPVDASWLETLQWLGIELLQFHPAHTYLSRGTVAAFQQAAVEPFVLHVTPLVDAVKPQVPLPESGEHPVWLIVQGTQAETAALIESLNRPPDIEIDHNQEVEQVNFYLRLRARVTPEGQAQLLQDRRVLAIEPYEPLQPEDEVAGLILAGQYNALGQPSGSYLRWLEDQGLNGEGVTIGIVDTGVDTSHIAFRDRIRDLNEGRKAWHGTFVAGHAAGCYLAEKDGKNFIYGLGVAPAAHLLSQDNQRTPTSLCQETVNTPAPSGIPGLVQNNSWGAGTREVMDYGSQEATYDHLVRNADPNSPVPKPLTICFSSGNSGAAGLTRPKSAKNLIITGNSENYRPDIGKDQSDNIHEIYSGPRASSHGNCGDGRIRPHVVTAGEWTASANYDSRPGQKEYISPNLTWGGGSSGASPKTAGACALLIQWWRRHNKGQNPSPAMLRALIVNGAEPIESGGPIPNKIQGWGRLNLANSLANQCQRLYVDQTHLLKQRGDQFTWQIRVADPKQPLKITLAWTDPPGAIGSGLPTVPAIVNKLALRIEVNGKLYRGNQFQNGWSYAEGTPDREGWDNLQNVYLPTGAAIGSIRVSVVALDITTNCFTGQITNPQQDFALVVTNAQVDPATTPAVVFVGVDNAGSGQPKPHNPEDFWATVPGSDDANLLQSSWWNTIHAQAENRTPAAPTNRAKSTPSDVASWWMAEDVVWQNPESDRPSSVSDDKQLLQAIQSGIGLVTGSGNNVVVAAHPASDRNISDNALTSIIAETEPEAAYLQTLSALTTSLQQTLANLMSDWEQFNPSSPTKAISRRVAVLVVGAGTRVTYEDLEAMRRLSFLGDLYLVSDHDGILAFLAQRLYRSVGVHFRLAEDSRSLPSLIQETLAEASGAQRVEVTTQVLGSDVVQHSFQVVAADVHLTIQIQFPPEVQPEICLVRPDRIQIALTSDQRDTHLQLTRSPGLLQIDLNAADLTVSKVGQWAIQLRQLGNHRDRTRVRVWARSHLQINIQQQIHAVPESDRDSSAEATETLISISNEQGILFHRLQSQPRFIGASNIAEAERAMDVQIESLRREDESNLAGLPNLRSASSYSPIISTWLQMPTRSKTGVAIADLPLRLEGIDGDGQRFTRILRHNLIHLQPYSVWRESLSQPSILLVTAEIAAVYETAGEITRLQLRYGDRDREVIIRSPQLRQQLTWLNQSGRRLDQPKKMWQFAVVSQEVVAAVQLLDPRDRFDTL